MKYAAIIIAYDGGLVRSLEARTAAILEGLRAEGIERDVAGVHGLVAGRSLAEAVLAAAQDVTGAPAGAPVSASVSASAQAPDMLSLELASLRAERTFASVAARGLPLEEDTFAFVQEASARTRVVIRADSRRSDVSRMLAMSHLEQHVTFTCCSDDRGLLAKNSVGDASPMIHTAYGHILRRLSALGIAAADCGAFELSEFARHAAASSGFRVLDELSIE